MSDESDDIYCPPCQTNDSEKTEKSPMPLSKAPNPKRKSRTASEKVSSNNRSSASREPKTESKPKRKAVPKPAGRGKPKRPPPKRVQPPARRKKVGKGLQFEDDLSPAQETVCLLDYVQSSSDEDSVGKHILTRSRKKTTKQKETRSDRNDKHPDEVSESGNSSNREDGPSELKVLPAASESASFAVTTNVPIGCTATHELIDELFGEELVQESRNPEATACTSRIKTDMDTESGDNCAVSASSVSNTEDSESALSASVQPTSKSKDHWSNASDKEYCTGGESSKHPEKVDLDAELFGF